MYQVKLEPFLTTSINLRRVCKNKHSVIIKLQIEENEVLKILQKSLLINAPEVPFSFLTENLACYFLSTSTAFTPE